MGKEISTTGSHDNGKKMRLQLVFSLNEQWVNMLLSFSTRSYWDVLPSNHKIFQNYI